jgi:hypothetical protein
MASVGAAAMFDRTMRLERRMRASDAFIAAMGIACASIVKIARPAANAIETSLFMKVSFRFRNRHNLRSQLHNGPDMNVRRTVAARRFFRSNLAVRGIVGPMFLALIDRKGLPKFARDSAIFAVDFDNEFFGTLKARERSGISVELLC